MKCYLRVSNCLPTWAQLSWQTLTCLLIFPDLFFIPCFAGWSLSSCLPQQRTGLSCICLSQPWGVSLPHASKLPLSSEICLELPSSPVEKPRSSSPPLLSAALLCLSLGSQQDSSACPGSAGGPLYWLLWALAVSRSHLKPNLTQGAETFWQLLWYVLFPAYTGSRLWNQRRKRSCSSCISGWGWKFVSCKFLALRVQQCFVLRRFPSQPGRVKGNIFTETLEILCVAQMDLKSYSRNLDTASDTPGN